ncbi:Anaphase-promoting complex subunit 1 [Leucoagaricus sp. SymC.cos]|nr:Anaphase-promoting complex subunit 1 [Leucoagaricus sp. SymC.cos]
MARSLSLPLQPLTSSAAAQFLEQNSPSCSNPARESKLLRAIRSALRGSDTENLATIQSSFHHDTQLDGRELTWNATTVVWSQGGVIRRRWSFEQESETIQWACLGMLEQIDPIPRDSTTISPTLPPSAHKSDKPSSERTTFGPFARAQTAAASQVASKRNLVPAIFVFLRSVGRIILQNGIEYSLSLPFIVRKAWPLSPHGVMIQRVLEPSEFVEAELTGEAVLPTIFSMTSPLAEAAAVGLTVGIQGGWGSTSVTLKDEDENSTKPLRSIPSTEMIVTVTRQGKDCTAQFALTVDVEQRRVSVWQYAYLKPKDLPTPLTRNRSQEPKKRHSMAGPGSGSRRTSAIYDGAGRGSSQRSAATTAKGQRSSLSKNDLNVIMDRMMFGGHVDEDLEIPIEHGRMKAAYWMERLYSQEIAEDDAKSWREITLSAFDERFDGTQERCLLSIQLPRSRTAHILKASLKEDDTMKVEHISQFSALASTSIRATREFAWDLLVLKPDHRLILQTHGFREIPIQVVDSQVSSANNSDMDVEVDGTLNPIVHVSRVAMCSVALTFANGRKARLDLPLNPNDPLTEECLAVLAQCLTPDASFILHGAFLERWCHKGLSSVEGVQFDCLTDAIHTVFQLKSEPVEKLSEPWDRLAQSTSHQQFKEDPVLFKLRRPTDIPPLRPVYVAKRPSKLLSPMLYALHTFAEYLRLIVPRHEDVLKLVPVICRLALEVRPEWADYWQRLVPDPAATTHLDDRIPVWPPDISAIFYGRLSNPEWKVPWHDTSQIAARFGVQASYEYGRRDPLNALRDLSALYSYLTDGQTPDIRTRAERAILLLIGRRGEKLLDSLPLGIAAPIREAARTCQLAPPPAWPLQAYMTIGRNDLAASVDETVEQFNRDGFKSKKDFLSPGQPRQTISHFVSAARAAGGGEVDVVTGVELDLEAFTSIRFGQDRRLEEVTRMLRSSAITSIKIADRPDLSEHDQTKEHQNHVIRVAERTLALPYGRAMFTFGSVPTVTREAYTIPKIEFTIRVQPLNITVQPEAGKIPIESMSWGEFHNGVAAGLRISPTATGVESSWIAFNKPSELSPEHAGFLLGLGLTGHLKHMMTWHTFSYLTPKHDLTSIGVLLGLSAANIGSADQHVTKLLAVHTPALLPTPSIDLNVSLMTQAAGLAGVGLLYLGTKNRRMAEVCLNQISRKDLVQPDLSNEHREAYTYAAALAFGMIMLGKGTTIPADVALLSRLTTLVHGDADPMVGKKTKASFDVNLTSPAATIALGLMYLRTERQDIADLLPIPDTVLALNRIQPSFLTIRTIARNLIMWNEIAPSNEWLMSQIPQSIREAIEAKSKHQRVIDESMELAYYNVLAGCCFMIGLKYAGTARQEAYLLIVRYFDLYTRMAYTSGPAFDLRIKRSAVRDGLNLISISLSMVMAGTGEISCLRRLRYAYGIYQQSGYHHGFKYGVHISTHMALGLLFLGAGRFTLGTSDAAIACLVTAFFPRYHSVSSDNKSFLQALRHLWALAVEPRCLIARDVDSGEVVYLPVKIMFREEKEKETSVTLISPTLIPDMDKLVSIRVDTPRYWPFYLDTEQVPRHKEALLKSQTLYVKRRTAFLSYTEDPKGSRSLFVRSGSSAGDPATLDFPQLTDTKIHPASDLSEFITSFSNDVLFLAFADHLARGDDDSFTDKERLFHKYCHAALLDSILQDKLQTLQSHLTLYQYKAMNPRSRYFNLRLQDLRFAADFYSKIYDRRFSGRANNNPRPPLIRDTAVLGALYSLDRRLETVRGSETFLRALGQYARGEFVTGTTPSENDEGQGRIDAEDDLKLGVMRQLGWYLLRNGVPVSTLLVVLRQLAQDAHRQCLGVPPPEGTSDAALLDLGIKEVLHGTGTKMTTALGSGWSAKSLDEIIHVWGLDATGSGSSSAASALL